MSLRRQTLAGVLLASCSLLFSTVPVSFGSALNSEAAGGHGALQKPEGQGPVDEIIGVNLKSVEPCLVPKGSHQTETDSEPSRVVLGVPPFENGDEKSGNEERMTFTFGSFPPGYFDRNGVKALTKRSLDAGNWQGFVSDHHVVDSDTTDECKGPEESKREDGPATERGFVTGGMASMKNRGPQSNDEESAHPSAGSPADEQESLHSWPFGLFSSALGYTGGWHPTGPRYETIGEPFYGFSLLSEPKDIEGIRESEMGIRVSEKERADSSFDKESDPIGTLKRDAYSFSNGLQKLAEELQRSLPSFSSSASADEETRVHGVRSTENVRSAEAAVSGNIAVSAKHVISGIADDVSGENGVNNEPILSGKSPFSRDVIASLLTAGGQQQSGMYVPDHYGTSSNSNGLGLSVSKGLGFTLGLRAPADAENANAPRRDYFSIFEPTESELQKLKSRVSTSGGDSRAIDNGDTFLGRDIVLGRDTFDEKKSSTEMNPTVEQYQASQKEQSSRNDKASKIDTASKNDKASQEEKASQGESTSAHSSPSSTGSLLTDASSDSCAPYVPPVAPGLSEEAFLHGQLVSGLRLTVVKYMQDQLSLSGQLTPVCALFLRQSNLMHNWDSLERLLMGYPLTAFQDTHAFFGAGFSIETMISIESKKMFGVSEDLLSPNVARFMRATTSQMLSSLPDKVSKILQFLIQGQLISETLLVELVRALRDVTLSVAISHPNPFTFESFSEKTSALFSFSLTVEPLASFWVSARDSIRMFLSETSTLAALLTADRQREIELFYLLSGKHSFLFSAFNRIKETKADGKIILATGSLALAYLDACFKLHSLRLRLDRVTTGLIPLGPAAELEGRLDGMNSEIRKVLGTDSIYPYGGLYAAAMRDKNSKYLAPLIVRASAVARGYQQYLSGLTPAQLSLFTAQIPMASLDFGASIWLYPDTACAELISNLGGC